MMPEDKDGGQPRRGVGSRDLPDAKAQSDQLGVKLRCMVQILFSRCPLPHL